MAVNLAKHVKQHPDYRAPSYDVKAACRADSFELRHGELFLKDAPEEPWLKVEPAECCAHCTFAEPQGSCLIEETYYEPPSELPDWENGQGNMSATYAYGVQGAEVEVDPETGEVKILRMVSAHDVGKVLNPGALAGQVYGGLAQGIGYALYEQVQCAEGRVQNPSFTDYKIPTAGEMAFPIDLEFVETGARRPVWRQRRGGAGSGADRACYCQRHL